MTNKMPIQIFYKAMVMRKRLARWLRLHGFQVEYIFLYRKQDEAPLGQDLIRRVLRLHRIRYQLHSLIELPLVQVIDNQKMVYQRQRLPSVKMLPQQ